MELQWNCDSVEEMFLAVTLVFWVHGYGRLDIDHSSLWIGCPPEGFPVSPQDKLWGEAGTGCEYTDQPCASHGIDCLPALTIDEMTLSTFPDGAARSQHARLRSCAVKVKEAEMRLCSSPNVHLGIQRIARKRHQVHLDFGPTDYHRVGGAQRR